MTNTLDYAEQAGRVGPHKESHEERLLAHNFLAPGVTPVSGFMKFSVVGNIGNRWGMAYNADLGCCGFSMWQHYNAAIALANGEPWEKVRETCWLPHYPSLPPAYYAYGIAQGEPGPEPDEGVSNAAMFGWAYKLGMIDGYMEVPLTEADWYAMTFHGMGLGQVLDGNQAIADFNAKPKVPWKAMGKGDGHDTLYVEGDGEGNGLEVSWGACMPFELSYRQNNWTDGWVIVDKENDQVDQEKLDAVLTEMHGVTERPSNNVAKFRPVHTLENVFDKGKELLEEHYKALDRELLGVLTKSMNRAEIALITAELLRIAAEIGV